MSDPHLIIVGNAVDELNALPAESVQCVVTSPPYWRLRNYHHPDQLGMEKTIGAYVANVVTVCRGIRHVLADDGVFWLNLGDRYSRGKRGAAGRIKPGETALQVTSSASSLASGRELFVPNTDVPEKGLCGLPWRVAIALQDDGWILRTDVIWHKLNSSPSSVNDRPTRNHEYLFMLVKSPRYFYDRHAISVPYAESTLREIAAGYDGGKRNRWKDYESNAVQDPSSMKARIIAGARKLNDTNTPRHAMPTRGARGRGANKRTVWSLPTRPFRGAHFATFPPELVEPCVLSTSRPGGKRCDCDEVIATPLLHGAGQARPADPTPETGRAGYNRRRRDGEDTRPMTWSVQRSFARQLRASPHVADMRTEVGKEAFAHYVRTDRSGARPVPPTTLARWLERGWLVDEHPPCEHPDHQPDTVLDPFTGSGTTGLVAVQHGRRFVGIELNAEYAEMARRRIIGSETLPLTEVVLLR